MQDNLCFHCHLPMQLPDPDKCYPNGARNEHDVASYDHLLPRSLGGRGGGNLVIAHRSCNSKRGHKLPSSEEVDHLRVLNAKRALLFGTESA